MKQSTASPSVRSKRVAEPARAEATILRGEAPLGTRRAKAAQNAAAAPDPGQVGFKTKRTGQPKAIVSFVTSGVPAHDAVMKGVSGRHLTRIWQESKGTLPKEAILRALGVSERTALRIKANPDKPLDPQTTDGIYRLESVRALALEVLGSVEAANEWLNTEALGLEYRKPIDLVSSSPGAEAVKTLLQRMKYGVYA